MEGPGLLFEGGMPSDYCGSSVIPEAALGLSFCVYDLAEIVLSGHPAPGCQRLRCCQETLVFLPCLSGVGGGVDVSGISYPRGIPNADFSKFLYS